MAKFDYLKEQQVSADRTAEVDVYVRMPNGLQPTLIGRPATEINRAYFNAQLKLSAGQSRRIRKKNVDVEMLAMLRRRDRELYPKHVITDWRGVVDSNGDPVAFSPEECADFLAVLPDYIFDEVRQFFSNNDNFVADLIPPEDAAQLGKS